MSATLRRLAADLGEALEQLEAATANAAREDLPAMLAELERVRAVAWLRISMKEDRQDGADRLVDAKEAASRLHIEVSALYRRRWPFRVEVSPGRTRYSLRGIERFIRAREGR